VPLVPFVTVFPLAVVVGAAGAGAGAGDEGRGIVRTVVLPDDRGAELTRVGELVVGAVVLGAPVAGTSCSAGCADVS
jgi:hypothetical protein